MKQRMDDQRSINRGSGKGICSTELHKIGNRVIKIAAGCGMGDDYEEIR